MKLINLLLGSVCILPMIKVNAAAMDQSGQSILPFLEKGNYSEAGVVIADPHVSGEIKNRPELVDDPNNTNTGDMASSVEFYNFALKLQLTDRLSFGLLYDLMCAELTGDFHLGDSRQLTDKSLLPFDLVS